MKSTPREVDSNKKHRQEDTLQSNSVSSSFTGSKKESSTPFTPGNSSNPEIRKPTEKRVRSSSVSVSTPWRRLYESDQGMTSSAAPREEFPKRVQVPAAASTKNELERVSSLFTC